MQGMNKIYSDTDASINQSFRLIIPEPMIGLCWLKTKQENYKEYQVVIEDGSVILRRPKSAK